MSSIGFEAIQCETWEKFQVSSICLLLLKRHIDKLIIIEISTSYEIMRAGK